MKAVGGVQRKVTTEAQQPQEEISQPQTNAPTSIQPQQLTANQANTPQKSGPNGPVNGPQVGQNFQNRMIPKSYSYSS